MEGSAGIYSDYDILIIIRNNIDWREKDRILDVISDFNLKWDILIDAHIISEPDLNTIKGKQPYIQKALESRVAV